MAKTAGAMHSLFGNTGRKCHLVFLRNSSEGPEPGCNAFIYSLK